MVQSVPELSDSLRLAELALWLQFLPHVPGVAMGALSALHHARQRSLASDQMLAALVTISRLQAPKEIAKRTHRRRRRLKSHQVIHPKGAGTCACSCKLRAPCAGRRRNSQQAQNVPSRRTLIAPHGKQQADFDLPNSILCLLEKGELRMGC